MSAICEYVNDYLYFVVQPAKDGDALLYCSGVNIDRFSPITKGRHGIGSNPAMRGLQLVNLAVRDLVLSEGATPRRIKGNDCKGIAPTGDTWYTEFLLIEKAPELLPVKILPSCVLILLKKIFKASMLEVALPETPPGPDELQGFLDDLCGKYGESTMPG